VGATLVDTPIFRYYAFGTTTPPEPDALIDPGAGTLNETQLQSIARIAVSYRVNPSNKTYARGETAVSNDVYVRTADPNASTPKPSCAGSLTALTSARSAASRCSSPS
jgi:hypothetical protein